MRALLNGERFLDFVGFPAKSFTQTSSNYVKAHQSWNQIRVYSRAKTPRYPENDVIDAVKNGEDIKHLKNGTLFRTDKPQHPFDHQKAAYSKQVGSAPIRKSPDKKIEPPAFCDPIKKDAPCVLQPEKSNEEKYLRSAAKSKNVPVKSTIPGFPGGKFPCLDKKAEKSKVDTNGCKLITSKKDKNDKDSNKKDNNLKAKISKKSDLRCEDKPSTNLLVNDRKLKKLQKKNEEVKPKKTGTSPLPVKDEDQYDKCLRKLKKSLAQEAKIGLEKKESSIKIEKKKKKAECLQKLEKKNQGPGSSSKPNANSDMTKKKDQTANEKRKQNLLTFPVVPLNETLQRFLYSVKPLLKTKEFKLQQKITKEFEEGVGAELQTLLEKAAKSKSNWLTEHWIKGAYLKVRSSVTINTSPCMAFPLQKFLQPIDYFAYVAKCIYGMLEFKQMVDDNKIPVVKMCQFELDNSQFGKIFGSVRKPRPRLDVIEQFNYSDYIVVINKNNFYHLPVYKSDGKIIHAHAIRDQLENITNSQRRHGDVIGLLTHDKRDNWAEAYTVLRSGTHNNCVLNDIESALFTVSLDECVKLPPKGEERALQAAHLLHGGGWKLNSANRWMDKTLQLIANPNGFSGICFEHSPADSQPLAMLSDFVQQKIHQPGYGCESCNDETIETFKPLTFEPLNECVELWISVAKRNINQLCRHLQLHIFTFDCHGKNFIMAQGLNTDSYIQVALQLAFFMVHQELPAVYESAHLRIFENGRTEAIRSATRESLAFVKAMSSHRATKKDRMEGLRSAVDAHQELTKLALHGRGIDRHLFGLQQMAIEKKLPMPEFFKSEGYLKSINFRIFSSQVACTHNAFLTQGPLTPCGYGCSYNPRLDDIIFSISTWKTNETNCAKLYGNAINDALSQIRKLILDTGGDSVSIDICKCDSKRNNK